MLDLRGHSKFKTELVNQNGVSYVRKSAPPVEWPRLVRQMARQSRAQEIYPKFKAPAILARDNEQRCFLMEYLPHRSPIFHLSNVNHYARRRFYNDLAGYLADKLTQSSITKFDTELFHDKIRSTVSNIDIETKSDLEKSISKLMEMTSWLTVDYIAEVHGDFTLSNLLVDESGQIYWFDFIDGWNHSVMIDFAKLFQEIRYGWSHRFTNKWNVDYATYRGQMIELSMYLDEVFYFTGSSLLLTAYTALNDLRLLQYERDPLTVERISYKIKETLQCI